MEQSYRSRGRPSLFSQRLWVEILLGPSKEEADEILRGSHYRFIKINFTHFFEGMEVEGTLKKLFEILSILH